MEEEQHSNQPIFFSVATPPDIREAPRPSLERVGDFDVMELVLPAGQLQSVFGGLEGLKKFVEQHVDCALRNQLFADLKKRPLSEIQELLSK
jgi:hypothetical protein